MKRFIVITLLVILCFILQSSILPMMAFSGIVPNLLVILTASFGFMRGSKGGMLIGFFCGLLLDIFGGLDAANGSVLGYYALLLLFIGYCNGFFERLFYPEDIKLPLLLIFLSDIGYGIINYIILFLMRGRLQLGYYFTHIILPEAVYTIVVAFAVYPLLLLIHKKLAASERKETGTSVNLSTFNKKE